MPRRSPRTRIALLVMALLLATIAVPASAAVDTSFSCPGSIPAAGFTDVSAFDATTQRAIDCLAVHGITKGTSPTTFTPGAPVPRWQMALFLVRQAESHGATIPDGADQGFADLGGLSTEARLAVNRLAQLGITLGTSPTTFSPNEDVTRWQMALFITRLLAASGTPLPTPATQGFTDLDSMSVQARNAIDQLAILGIAEGTSSTTFSPTTKTLRWHMALFLTRALAVGGILPPGSQPLMMSPGTAAFLSYTGTPVSRQYTVAVGVSVPLTIELWPASSIRANGTFEAASPGTIANCTITLVDGAAHHANKITGIEASNGNVNLTVGCTGLQAAVVPVVYTGTSLTGLAGASPTDPRTPTNDAYAVGGSLTVVAEAASGPFGPVTVDAVDKTTDSFTSGGFTYFFDANDIYLIEGVPVTMAAWKAALTTGDVLRVGSVYATDPAASSTFDLDDIAPVAPGFTVTAITATTATFTYTAAPGSDFVRVYSCQGGGCPTTLLRTVVAGLDEDGALAGTQIVITGLTPNTSYVFQATQVEDSNESAKSAAVNVTTPVALTVTTVTVQEANDGVGTWTGLLVSFDKDVVFNPAVQLSDIQIHTASQPSLKIDAVLLANGPGSNELSLVFPSQNDTTPDTDWVLTIASGALQVGAGADPNGVVTAAFAH